MIPTLLTIRRQAFFILVFTLSAFCASFDLRAQTGGEVFFRDDFNATNLSSLWQSPTSWKVKHQWAYLYADGGDRWLRTAQNYAQSSYVIETAAKGFTVNYYRAFRITFGQEDASNQKMYIINYHPDFGGLITLGISTDNFYYPDVLDKASLFPQTAVNQVVKFKIARYESGLIQVYVDRGTGYGNTPLLEAIDQTHRTLGHVAWREDTETYAEEFFVDYITAYKPLTEKPAVLEKPSEDELFKQVTAESSRSYKITKLTPGVNPYTDRPYVITSVPSYLNGASFVQTAMDDKKSNSATFLTSFIKKRAIVYIGYDPRAVTIPDWLQDWTKTGDRIELTDPGTPYVDVYAKMVDMWRIFPYPFIIGGNLASPAVGAKMNYFLAAVEIPGSQSLEAEKATLSGVKVANNHTGYSGTGFADYINPSNDFIEWDVTTTVPGLYYLTFGFSNGSSASRSLQLAHNGVPVGPVVFRPTSSWNSWAYLLGPKVFLAAGTHKIRATAIGTSGPNMDFLSVSYAMPATNPNFNSALLTASAHAGPKPVGTLAPPRSASVMPNPFTSKTNIAYEVTHAGRVTISVFNVHGHPVRVLVNQMRQPGKYTEEVDGAALLPGTYIYHIQYGNRTETGKFIRL